MLSKLKDLKFKFIVSRFPRLFSSFQYLIVIAYMYILYITVYIMLFLVTEDHMLDK